MKQRILDFLESIRYIWEPVCVWLAPVLIFLAAVCSAYGAAAWTLPEILEMYSSVLLIMTFFFVACFLLACVPCAVYSCVLAVKTMLRRKCYGIPIAQILLNVPLLVLWYLVVQRLIL